MYLQLSAPRGCIITLRQRLVRIARLDTSAHKRAHWNVKHALQSPRHWWRDLKCALVSLPPSVGLRASTYNFVSVNLRCRPSSPLNIDSVLQASSAIIIKAIVHEARPGNIFPFYSHLCGEVTVLVG